MPFRYGDDDDGCRRLLPITRISRDIPAVFAIISRKYFIIHHKINTNTLLFSYIRPSLDGFTMNNISYPPPDSRHLLSTCGHFSSFLYCSIDTRRARRRTAKSPAHASIRGKFRSQTTYMTKTVPRSQATAKTAIGFPDRGFAYIVMRRFISAALCPAGPYLLRRCPHRVP